MGLERKPEALAIYIGMFFTRTDVQKYLRRLLPAARLLPNTTTAPGPHAHSPAQMGVLPYRPAGYAVLPHHISGRRDISGTWDMFKKMCAWHRSIKKQQQRLNRTGLQNSGNTPPPPLHRFPPPP